MKLKINKACDLSSISVLPPQSRRASTVPNGQESSVFGKIQASQLRSQPSQQSFSQGVSSQHGMFSQFSQNSLDEIVTNDQRYCSQERENSVKKISCLPPVNYMREESHMPISISSNSLMRKWNSASISDHRCQISEELEHRIGVIETSINRFGRILESIQSDVIQVNKGTKEASMEMEGIRQKLSMHDNLLQLMNKGQEDIKTCLDGGLKSISDQLSLDLHGERLREISLMLSAFPEKIDACLTKLKLDLCNTFTREMQEMACSLKRSNQTFSTSTVLPSAHINYHAIPHQMLRLKNPVMSPKLCEQATPLPKIEMGSWTSVKQEKSSLRASNKEHIQNRVPPAELEREWRVIVESDEDIDGGFSCLLEERETEDMGNYSMAEAKEETQRILRKARRRKRKYCNTIIIN